MQLKKRKEIPLESYGNRECVDACLRKGATSLFTAVSVCVLFASFVRGVL
jgi:hypothetical protein